MSTFQEEMEGFRLATMQVVISIRDELTPVIERLAFSFQRIHVDYLNSQPWYRHLRDRWRLRKARKWTGKDKNSTT